MKILTALAFTLLCTGTAAFTDPVDRNRDTLFIGHSLVAFDMPTILQGFVAHSGGTAVTEAQIINGAPLMYNWNNGADAQGVNARKVLPSGRFGALVVTEAVPLINHLTYSQTIETAAQYHALATAADPETQVFLYETWHDLRSGTGVDIEWDDGDDVLWRMRLDNDLKEWMSIVEGVNNTRASGTSTMQLIPAGQAMGALSDAIQARRVPGLQSIDDLYDDGIHPNTLGNYFVALVMAASIYGIDPTTLPHRGALASYRQYDLPPETAAALQKIAAQAVRDLR